MTRQPNYYAGILYRSAIVAAVIGTVLTFINQPEAFFGNHSLKYLSLTLNFATPFVVVAISQFFSIRKALADIKQGSKLIIKSEGMVATMLGHGIPLRALLISLVIGSLNAGIVISVTLIGSGDLSNLPLSAMAQAYVLPALFGIISQTISYRRTLHAPRIAV